MIRCNNCMTVWNREEEIPMLIQYPNGDTHLYHSSLVKPGGEVFPGCPFCETDSFLMELDVPSMESIYDYKLPGFYRDERGAYGIVIGDKYLCCFVNQDDFTYDVTLDEIGPDGTFSLNNFWNGYQTAREAINCIKELMLTLR